MQLLRKRTQELAEAIEKSYVQLTIDEKVAEKRQLDTQLAKPEVWDDSTKAQELTKQAVRLGAQVDPWVSLRAQIKDNMELLELDDTALELEVEQQIDSIEAQYKELKKQLLFGGVYDDHNAILRITAGVGGTDAQDWASMLERMYLRWAERSGVTATTVERSTGEEAGIKTSVIEMTGMYTYGRLRSENGVHRLVRLSPFNSDNLRQTSFALVEILPQIDAPEAVGLEDKDLKIDVYRAGGHGGQSVNTTDSAVRVTHLPTNTVVAIQNERSQLQNKETALKILRSKLAQMKLEQHAEKMSDLQAGESANWGSQIRNYVLHPYTLVKDTRTKYEEKDAQKVLDGKIDGLIDSYLEANLV